MYLKNYLKHRVKLLNTLILLKGTLSLSSCYALKEVTNNHRTEHELRITEKTERKSLEDSLILTGRIQKGFTKKQVIKAYGKPYKKYLPQRIPYKYSMHFIQQWVYLDRQQYVYFLDGKVDAIRNMREKTKSK